MNSVKKYDFIFIFLLIFFIYNITTKLAINEDTIPNALLPFLIIGKHTIYFDSIIPQLAQMGDTYQFVQTHGHYASVFTIVTGVLVTPIYFLHIGFLSIFPQHGFSYYAVLSKFSATIITAFAGTTVYLTSKMLFKRKIAIITMVIFAFGTVSWGVSSQALWQHGTSELLLAIALFCIIANELKPKTKYFVILGIVSGLFFFNRPPDSLLLIPVLYYLWSNRKNIIPFIVGALVSGVPFLIYNLVTLTSATATSGPLNTLTGFMNPLSLIVHFAGYFISPNRGLFIYSPILLFAVWGYYVLYKTDTVSKQVKMVLLLFLPCIMGTILIYSAYTPWFGGWTFGPRYLTGFLPVLAIVTTFGIMPFLWPKNRTHSTRIISMIILFLILISISIEAIGAWCYPYAEWDKNVDDNKVWNWSDSQIAGSYYAGITSLDNVQILIWPSCPPPIGYIQVYSNENLLQMISPGNAFLH